MGNTRPYVSAAFVCEKVLQEKDGVFSAIRMVDTFHIPETPADVPADVRTVLPLTALVGVKSGDLVGTYEIRLVLRSPTGASRSLDKYPIVLKGGEHGFNLTVQFQIEVKDLGLYWFDVMWGDEVLTSIPLKLVQAQPAARGELPQTS